MRVSMPVQPTETSQFQTNATVAGQKPIGFTLMDERNDFLPAERNCSSILDPIRVSFVYFNPL